MMKYALIAIAITFTACSSISTTELPSVSEETVEEYSITNTLELDSKDSSF